MIDNLKMIFEELRDEYFFYSYGIDGIFTYLSPSITNVLGYSTDEFMTHYSKYLSKIPINEEAIERKKMSIQGVKQPSHELEILHKDGTIRNLAVREIPVLDKEGKVIYIEGIAHDITKYKKTEELLKKESYLNRAIAHLNNKILYSLSIEDISYFILEYSQKLTDSPFGYVGYIDSETGYMIAPTLTRDIWDICKVQDKNVVFKQFRGLWGWVLNNRQSILINNPSEDSRTNGVPDGHIPIKRFISVPSIINGKLVGQIALANSNRDYTLYDLKVLEQISEIYAIALNRKKSEDAAYESKKLESLRKLARGIAHDFRNIISIIMGNIEYIKYFLSEESDIYQCSEAILCSSRQARDLTMQLSQFAKQAEIQYMPLNISAIISGSIKLIESMLPKTIQLKYNIYSNGNEDKVMGDISQIYQIITNLVINAQHAMTKKGGILEIGVKKIENEGLAYVNIEISDNGVGIEKKNLEKIFEPYFTTKKNQEEKGLGLTIVHSIVTQMKGHINVKSELYKGTIFNVYLPIIK
ncbi:MAG: PAS domain-containing sensor histidine kinase [Desulfobacterales bacterium]|nr:PAS domain-containing sensor histidine kinase [Desulfobacterales bacterium]